MLFLEYAGRGSLDKIFCSLNDAHRNPATLPAPAPEVIPNRILWLMFQCRKFAASSVEETCRADLAVNPSRAILCRDGAPAHKGLGIPAPHRCQR